MLVFVLRLTVNKLLLPAGIATDSSTVLDKEFDPTGWELALVTTPSSNNATVIESKLVSFPPTRYNSSFHI